MFLPELRARLLARAAELENQLKQKYRERIQRIEEIFTILKSKIEFMDIYTAHDVVFTIILAGKEFPEILQLLPTERELEDMFNDEFDWRWSG